MKFVSLRRRATQIALFAAFFGAVLPVAQAQQTARTPNPAREALLEGLKSLQGNPRGMVPGRRYPMVGDARFLPPDVPVRSTRNLVRNLKSSGKAGASRVRVGGVNGANVLEKVVNLTRTNDPIDERTPTWTTDERFLYYSSNTAANARYTLFRIDAVPPSSTAANPFTSISDPADTQLDYLFPAINANGTRVAFIRSSDTKPVDATDKKWDLFVSDLPGTGAFIDTAVQGGTNLLSLTIGKTFPNGQAGTNGQPAFVGFANVGRPTWIGSTDLVFSAQLQGDTNFHLFTVNIQTGKIFQLTAGAADERNPQVSPTGTVVAFDSNAAPSTTGGTYVLTANTRPRTDTDPFAQPQSAPGTNTTGLRNIFVSDTLAKRQIKQVTLQFAGAPDVDNTQPAWSAQQNNSFTNVAGTTYYLAFSSGRIPQFAAGDTQQANVTGFAQGPAATRSLYYFVASRTGANDVTGILGEASPTDLDNLGADGARRLDTANDTLTNGILNDVTKPRFSDQYPAFAPFISVFRLAYQSNRNGDYNASGFGSGFSVATANNLFIASLIDITAPTLIRFDTSSPTGEVVHVNIVEDTKHPYNPNRSDRTRGDGITPGTTLHFAVRVEDRESGMRPENSPDGGAVYIQIKNPNSKYQSTATGGDGKEHKEYTSISSILVENNADTNFTNAATGFNAGFEYEAQAISTSNTLNTVVSDPARGSLYYSHQFSNFGGGPLYIAGIQDQDAFSGTTLPPLDGGTYTVPSVFGAGTTQQTTSNVWLRLKPLVQLDATGNPVLDTNGNPIPLRSTDQQGGILYGGTWTIPANEPSDWYLDVILYDNAVNPFDPRFRSNVIIYDNVWGFSSAPPIAGPATDVLVVADYPLGQKFFQSRFGPEPNLDALTSGGANLQPIFWGVESYFTDRDLNGIPGEQVGATALTSPPGGMTPRNWGTSSTLFAVSPQASNGTFGGLMRSTYPNALGVESYNDELIDPGAVDVFNDTNGKTYRLPPTGRYSIWRVLSRGRVPSTLLNDYLPQRTTSPADIAKNETAVRSILNANRMVVWTSPFSGNNFVGEGTITEIQTQNALANFVSNGGRLFISGTDIGFALVGNGQANSFFTNTLKAQFVTDSVGLRPGMTASTLAVANNYIGQIRHDPWDLAGNAQHAYGAFQPPIPLPYNPIDAGAPNNPFVRIGNNLATGDRVSDGALTSQLGGAYVDGVRSLPSTTPTGLPANTPPDSIDEFLYSGSPAPPAYAGPGVIPTQGTQISAIISSSSLVGSSATGRQPDYDPAKPFAPVGKVVYAAVGFESISQGWYVVNSSILTLGRRAELMHNITCSFRTGTLTGRVIDNDGSPVSDALIRAIPNVANDTLVAAGTALTDANGNFQIVGVQPGFYVLFGYKAGYYTQHNLGNTVHGGWRTTTQFQLKKASPGALGGIPNANATNNQGKSGGVFGPDGVTPVGNIEVQVRRLEPNGQWTVNKTYSSVNANDLGAYSFPNLAITDSKFGYVVIANPRSDVVNGVIVAGNAKYDPRYDEVHVLDPAQPTIRLGSGTTIDPNTGNTVVGPTVIVREGQTSLIDFLLPAAPGKVTGQVVNDTDNSPIVGAVVTAVAANGTAVAQGTTDTQGNYALILINPATGQDPTAIPGGTYTIQVTANGFTPTNALPTITIAGGDVVVPQIRMTPLPPGSVSGLVRRTNGSTPTTSGVGGATVTFYAVTTVGGVQQQAATASYTVTVSDTPTTDVTGYAYNYRIDAVAPGTYNAYVSKPGLTGSPSPFALTVTTAAETKSVNFSLEPPKIYGQGIQLLSAPQDFSGVSTAQVYGLGATADNDGNGVVNGTDAEIFRLFNVADWTGAQYNINPDIRLKLGKGYFVRFGAIAAVTAQGVPSNTNTYRIDLSAGWNLIGHPFSNQTNASDPAADIDLSDPSLSTYTYTAATGEQRTGVSLAQAVADGAVQTVAYSYTGSNAGSAYVQTSIIKPWFGYWFRAFVPVQVTLKYPGAGSRAVRASKANGGKFRTITREEQETIVPRSIPSRSMTDWRLQIAAQQGDLKDADNTIGVAPDAKDGFDNRYDNEKPPMMTEAPTLYLAVQGTSTTGRAVSMTDNVKTAGGGTKGWDLTVETTGTGDVTLYWPNVNRLPRGIEPVLVDVATGKRVAMRTGSGTFRFTPSGRAQRKFRVEVAPAASMPLDILNLHTAPGDASRGRAYQFRFTPTRAVDVTAEIQTVTGKTVRRMQSRAVGGSEASLTWDGRDEIGGFVPSGPYLISLSVRDEQGRQATRRVPVMINR